ncbi:MAG: AbrB/MazE/SpoVT family DNA-binding protein [Hyphomicrobiales bacterium]|nr:AbrB/MazE/SpoVT family DNA-binding protein [Hyphomicrobiales bacterium]
MATARVIRTGTKQMVELPEGVRLSAEIVEVRQDGDDVVLHPVIRPARKATMAEMLDAMAALGELIGDAPEDLPPEDRPGL